MSSAPTLEEVIELSIESVLENLHTSQPGIVTAFDKATHTVHVQPINKKYHQRETGEWVATTQPIVTKVPVVYNGSGANRITFPIAKGSIVLLVHLHASRDAWQFGQGNEAVETRDLRRHALTDAVAIPCLLTTRGTNVTAARVDDDGVTIHTSGKIRLGGGSTLPVTRTDDVEDVIRGVLQDPAILTAINAGGIGMSAALNAYFIVSPVPGSDVVEAE